MLEKIGDTAAETEEGAQCFVLFILSHGGEESVYGTDGLHLSKTSIVDVLDGCPSLKGIPRLLFLQSCRGSMFDVFVVNSS